MAREDAKCGVSAIAGGKERDVYVGGMIRTHYTRQTAIANSTPPVRDNYRAARGLAELPRRAKEWLPKMEVPVDRDRRCRLSFLRGESRDMSPVQFINAD